MICRLFAQQQKKQQLGTELMALLSKGAYNCLTIVVAFLRSEGVCQLEDALKKFVASGKKARFIIGISRKVTSYEGLKLLLKIGGEGSVFVFHNSNSSAGIFHPKLYLFEGENQSVVAVASNNFTESGLFLNYELAIIIELDPKKPEDQQLQNEINQYIAELVANGEVAKPLTAEFLEKLKESGAVEVEAQETDTEPEEEEKAEAKLEKAVHQNKIKGLFGSAPVTGVPSRPKPAALFAKSAAEAVPAAAALSAGTTLIMRPYPQRNGTQIQVPMMANAIYFNESLDVISEHNGEAHSIREAHSGGGVNTLKLEVPECQNLQVPIIVFRKTEKETLYRVMQGKNGEGAKLLKRLEDGLKDKSTRRTRKGSTMWRVE
ncbi:MAG TPA: phospholipase D-like domain-containing protein [Candidatus Angelobacter sp.]|nr:phospholipase D-like domain-containing protein [Candidatus Angelobacter sp.]